MAHYIMSLVLISVFHIFFTPVSDPLPLKKGNRVLMMTMISIAVNGILY